MVLNQALFTTGTDDWSTPDDFFCALDQEFHFTLDACALPENAKCTHYYTPDDDGLAQDWAGETVFCNPPYSNGKQNAWVKKCYEESQKPDTTVALLIPARTDTARFHDYILDKAEIRFVRGRLKFGGAKDPAPFPSMVVVYRKATVNSKIIRATESAMRKFGTTALKYLEKDAPHDALPEN